MIMQALLAIVLSGYQDSSGVKFLLDKKDNTLHAISADTFSTYETKPPMFNLTWASKKSGKGHGGGEGGQMIHKDGFWTFVPKKKILDGELYHAEIIKAQKSMYSRYFVRAIDSVFIIEPTH